MQYRSTMSKSSGSFSNWMEQRQQEVEEEVSGVEPSLFESFSLLGRLTSVQDHLANQMQVETILIISAIYLF